MGTIGSAIKGLTATLIGTGVATKKTLDEKTEVKNQNIKEQQIAEEQAKVDEVNNLNTNIANETLENVFKTTRKKDRNTFIEQFNQANELAQQRQEFINFQTQSYKQRILNAGGLNTPKGQAIKKVMDNQVKPIQQQMRKDLTQFRKKEDK